jgi:hypothetical protein
MLISQSNTTAPIDTGFVASERKFSWSHFSILVIGIRQTYSTLLVQHHGVVNSEILDLAFIAFWNQALHLFRQRTWEHQGMMTSLIIYEEHARSDDVLYIFK